MNVEILKNTVQKDNVNPADASEGELVHWKRIRSKGVAWNGDERAEFDVILEMRGRLMQVRLAEQKGLTAVEVGEGLVNKMCTFIAVPRSRLFVARPATSLNGAEWMVSDPEHVSGLLHRLAEEKVFEVPASAPYPAPLVEILEKLIDSVAENTRSMYIWQEHHNRSQPVYNLDLRTHVWEVLRPRFLELTDDPDMQANFAKFFDYVPMYAASVKTLLDSEPRSFQEQITNPRRSPAATAQATINWSHQDATQLGLRLIQRYGNEEQKKKGIGKIR